VQKIQQVQSLQTNLLNAAIVAKNKYRMIGIRGAKGKQEAGDPGAWSVLEELAHIKGMRNSLFLQ